MIVVWGLGKNLFRLAVDRRLALKGRMMGKVSCMELC